MNRTKKCSDFIFLLTLFRLKVKNRTCSFISQWSFVSINSIADSRMSQRFWCQFIMESNNLLDAIKEKVSHFVENVCILKVILWTFWGWHSWFNNLILTHKYPISNSLCCKLLLTHPKRDVKWFGHSISKLAWYTNGKITQQHVISHNTESNLP